MVTFAFTSNIRLHRFSSLSGTATALRTVLKADDVIDAGFFSESQCAVGKRRVNGDIVVVFGASPRILIRIQKFYQDKRGI